LKEFINKIFSKKPKKRDWFKDYPEVRIVPAFTLSAKDGYPETTYYEFEDPMNLTAGRGFVAVNYYKELSMGCTREFLIAHTEAVDKLSRPKVGERIDLPEIARLNLQLKERTEMVIDSLTPYKVASVIYFDETEDPYSYDMAYGMKKIERWKKENVSSFFLQTPVKNLIPSTLWSEETLENYMKVSRELDKIQYQSILDAISQVSSTNQLNSEWLKVLKLEKNII
jgi:hypothetical protein